jgi:hypothetical protein
MKSYSRFRIIAALALLCWVPILLNSCKKKETAAITTVTSANHTGKLTGARHWRAYQYHNYYGTDDTTYTNPDTSFAIIAINENKINFLGLVLSYNDTISTSAKWVFYDLDAKVYGPTLNYSTSVIYYSASDSIVYFSKSNVMNHFDYHVYGTL